MSAHHVIQARDHPRPSENSCLCPDVRGRPRRIAYASAGVALGVTALLGLLGLRASFAAERVGLGWLLRELHADALVYGYVGVFSVAVLAFFGWHLGRRQDELEITSITDPLTGLPNRRFFVRRVQEEVNRAARYGTPVSLLIIDVDDLKHINDRHGHSVGDNALRALADCLRATCRTTELAVRCGGDEFAVLVPETPAENALELAKRIQLGLGELCRKHEPKAPQVSVSIGVADIVRAGCAEREALFDAADQALYAAKAAGRNRVVLAPVVRFSQTDCQLRRVATAS